MKSFVKLGIIGLILTGVIQTVLYLIDVDSGFNFSNYIVWIVFLIIGLGQMARKRKEIPD